MGQRRTAPTPVCDFLAQASYSGRVLGISHRTTETQRTVSGVWTDVMFLMGIACTEALADPLLVFQKIVDDARELLTEPGAMLRSTATEIEAEMQHFEEATCLTKWLQRVALATANIDTKAFTCQSRRPLDNSGAQAAFPHIGQRESAHPHNKGEGEPAGVRAQVAGEDWETSSPGPRVADLTV